MSRARGPVLLFVTSVVLAVPVGAREQGKRAPILEAVVQCRAIADGAARLACYDSSVARLDTAEAKSDVVVVDREQIRDTRKKLFGLALPSLPVFSRDSKADEIEKVEYRLESVRRNTYGAFIFTLSDDGGTWRQTDTVDLAKTPKPGAVVRINKGAMGSYFLTVDGKGGMRVHRDN